MKRNWYMQVARRMRSGNVSRIRLQDGTLIDIWTHNGQSSSENRTLEIRVVGKSFANVSVFTQKP